MNNLEYLDIMDAIARLEVVSKGTFYDKINEMYAEMEKRRQEMNGGRTWQK
jgi:hypothetical protein